MPGATKMSATCAGFGGGGGNCRFAGGFGAGGREGCEDEAAAEVLLCNEAAAEVPSSAMALAACAEPRSDFGTFDCAAGPKRRRTTAHNFSLAMATTLSLAALVSAAFARASALAVGDNCCAAALLAGGACAAFGMETTTLLAAIDFDLDDWPPAGGRVGVFGAGAAAMGAGPGADNNCGC